MVSTAAGLTGTIANALPGCANACSDGSITPAASPRPTHGYCTIDTRPAVENGGTPLVVS